MNERVAEIARDAKKSLFAHWQTWIVLLLIFISGVFAGLTIGISYTSQKAAQEISSIREDYRLRADARDKKVDNLAERVNSIPDKTAQKLSSEGNAVTPAK